MHIEHTLSRHWLLLISCHGCSQHKISIRDDAPDSIPGEDELIPYRVKAQMMRQLPTLSPVIARD